MKVNQVEVPTIETMLDASVISQFDELQMEGEPDILIEVINSFLRTSAERMKDLITAIDVKNPSLIAAEAHALKSGAQTLGAMKLGELCQQLENLKSTNDFNQIQLLRAPLQETYEKSCGALKILKITRESLQKNKAT